MDFGMPPLLDSNTESCRATSYRLNMELDLHSLFWSCVQLYSLAETPQPSPSPRIWSHIRGRYWSAKIDDISL
jgi:hypothetical protein